MSTLPASPDVVASLAPPRPPEADRGGAWGTILANTAMWWAQSPAAQRFYRAAARPQEVQARKLSGLLAANQGTTYGQRVAFAKVRTLQDFQDRVPVVTYDDLAPWIERILAGENNVLTAEPVLMVEKSSGTAAASKFIPYTATLRAEFSAATGAWLHDLYGRLGGLRRGRSYWSVSPVLQDRQRTPSGLPIGFADDTEYFGAAERLLLGRVLAVPGLLAQVRDAAAWRYLTLYFLLATEDLAIISIWNPSFLTVLLGAIPAWSENLLADLSRGTLTPPGVVPAPLLEALRQRVRPLPRRAARLREVLSNPDRLSGRELWPGLQLVSCWTDATAQHFLSALQALIPGVPIQGKGLLSTEGAVSFPLVGQEAAVLAVTSHFYEFVPLDRPQERPLLAHQLDRGGQYRVLLTTGGGLYRYATGDAVEVVGRWAQLPLLRFLGKADMVSDLCGEKLAALFVDRALADVRDALGLADVFTLIAPELGDPPRYLVLSSVSEGELSRLAEELERRFLENHHYAYARRIGQLGPLAGVRIPEDAPARYLAACHEQGQRVGDVKPLYLQRTFGWRERLGARVASSPEERVEPHGCRSPHRSDLSEGSALP